MNKRQTVVCALITQIFFLMTPLRGYAQIQLRDPGISEKERLVYRERVRDRIQQLTVETRKIQLQNRTMFEVIGNSPSSDSRMLIDAASMTCYYSETVDRSADSTVKHITEIYEIKYKPKSDELVISDFNSLYYVLRGFPWASAKTAKLYFLGSGGTGSMGGGSASSESGSGVGSASNSSSGNSAFSFELKVVGKESIVIGGRTWQCWKVEMGLSGIIGAIFKKSNFWYATDPPFCMVKFEGTQGPPGTPLTTIELVSFE